MVKIWLISFFLLGFLKATLKTPGKNALHGKAVLNSKNYLSAQSDITCGLFSAKLFPRNIMPLAEAFYSRDKDTLEAAFSKHFTSFGAQILFLSWMAMQIETEVLISFGLSSYAARRLCCFIFLLLKMICAHLSLKAGSHFPTLCKTFDQRVKMALWELDVSLFFLFVGLFPVTFESIPVFMIASFVTIMYTALIEIVLFRTL